MHCTKSTGRMIWLCTSNSWMIYSSTNTTSNPSRRRWLITQIVRNWLSLNSLTSSLIPLTLSFSPNSNSSSSLRKHPSQKMKYAISLQIFMLLNHHKWNDIYRFLKHSQLSIWTRVAPFRRVSLYKFYKDKYVRKQTSAIISCCKMLSTFNLCPTWRIPPCQHLSTHLA